ncbi:hypothetical protein bcere0015_48030 [Bacillus cereus BDRD-Cer4]|nr:hypothetical protein bcere0015_48030 [Bacillus cereus BDRD-Cer4]
MKREALFKPSLLNRLKDKDLFFVKEYLVKKQELQNIQKILLAELNKKTKKYYDTQEIELLRIYQSLKRRIKRKLDVKESVDDSADKIINELISKYNLLIIELTSLKQKMNNVFQNKEKNYYEAFYTEEKFKKALKVTTPEAYKSLVDLNIQKDSLNRARYGYIQRATVKTSPLSYFGKTTYYSLNKKDSEETLQLNNVVKYLILTAAMNDVEVMNLLRIKINPVFKKINNAEGIYYEKNFLLNGVDWVLKQDDILHNKEVLNILKRIKICKTPNNIINALQEENNFTYEVLVNNGVIVPDYSLYINDDQKFKDIIVSIFGIQMVELLFPNCINDIQYEQISNKVLKYLSRHDSNYFGVSLCKKFLELPLYYHNDVEKNQFSVPSISSERMKEIFDDCVVQNKNSYYIYNLILGDKEKYQDQSLLAVITDIKEKYMFERNLTIKNTIKIKPQMRKSALIFYQSDVNGNIVINNINAGTGAVFHRNAEIFDKCINDNLKNYYNKLFYEDFPIYEVVMDEEISNHVDTGKSFHKKLKWPEDFLDIRLHVSADNQIRFVYKDEFIHLLYLGTIPFHLFYGSKGVLLNLIHPWNIDMKNLGELNNRKRYNLIVQDAIQSTDMSNWDFFMALSSYFTENNLPMEFFLRKNNYSFKKSKPIWISLYSSESIKVLKRILKGEKEVIIEEIYPNFNENLEQKVVEYAVLKIEE